MRFNKNPKGAGLLFLFLTFSLAACLLFSLVSITLMESFLALSFVFWIVLIIQGKEKFAVPGFFWPLLAYAGLSLLACAFSVNPEISFKDARELLLYLIIPVIMTTAASPAGRSKTTLALLASGFLSTLYSVGYFIWRAAPEERIQGFMGHYMTQAGLLLLFLCAAMGFVLFARDKTRWLWGVAFLLAAFCLALTYTRSAWVGFAVSSAFLVFLYKPKAFILVPVAIGLFFLISPQPIKRRALSIFSLKNYSNQLRIQYLRAGIRIIKEKPLFGTGPDTVDMVFQDPKYGLSSDARRNVHLHNNLIQIAAERGIPTLLVWLAFIAWAFVSFLPMLKTRDPSAFPHTATAAAALLALFTAGLFEYNFADSEVTILFLYLITAPFAIRKVLKS
jgi:O-antigen ligase